MNESSPRATFLGAPFAPPAGARCVGFAFLGIPLCVEYGHEPAPPADAAAAPSAADAVRTASSGYVDMLGNHDFDFAGALVPAGVEMGLVDCGDVVLDGGLGSRIAAATAVVREIVAAGAAPLVVGCDHSVPPVVVRGLDDAHPLDVLHIDAHLDFRDEVAGLRDGYSSPIRRLRELPWVRTIVQVGLRDVGSARVQEVEAARAAGNILVRAEEVHEHGVDRLIDLFPEGGRVYITLDVDGLDPSCAPGTLWPAPGGLWFWQVARLIRGVIGRSALAGMDVCEFVPACDPQGHTALAAARLLMNAIGAELRRR